jgi:hypothetical protein
MKINKLPSAFDFIKSILHSMLFFTSLYLCGLSDQVPTHILMLFVFLDDERNIMSYKLFELIKEINKLEE